MIKIINLTKRFDKRLVLKKVNLTLPDKGLVFLRGSSGSGKTTLLNVIGGIDKSYEGLIEVKNVRISLLNDEDLRRFRIYNIGYLFQNFNLLNLETVYENIKLPLDTISSQSTLIKRRRIKDIMISLQIDKLANTNVNKLSGGEKQRVAIARALVNSPSIILCDEPTGALDENSAKNVYEILKKISANILVIVASHDPEVINYADMVVNIRDGHVAVPDFVPLDYPLTYHKPYIGNNFKKHKPKLTSSFKISHSYHKMKSKKIRTLITNGILSLSLTGIGVSVLISNGISTKIKDSFASLTNGNQITMSLKRENANTFSNIYSAPEYYVDDIYQSYKNYLDGYGVSYLVNYEDFFKDRNDFYCSIRGEKYYINSLSTRSINEYRWLDNESEDIIYPYRVDTLEDDEIILGLDYVEMVNLCFKLQIQRSYSSLGAYVRNNQFLLNLEVENKSWKYDDEQVFLVRGIKEVKKSCLFHKNNIWNQIVFEKMMLLPSSDNDETFYPWEMYKLFYLRPIEDVGTFINRTLLDSSLHDFVFERTNYSYTPSLCKINEVCSERVVFVFLSDKYAINTGIVNGLIKMEDKLKSYYYLSSYGYSSYASNVLNGFSKNFFISSDLSKVEMAVDADTMNNDVSLKVDLPDGVINGYFLNSIDGGLRFSSKPKQLIKGRLPKNLNEIAISSGLIDKLGSDVYGSELYFAGLNSEIITLNGSEKDYRFGKLVVVGVVNEEKSYFYHEPNWSISFFRDIVGVSNFNLCPTSVVFELDQDVDAHELCDKLNSTFKDFKFVSPSDELSKSIETTLQYANSILLVFSLVASLISLILLGTVLMLNIIESKQEITLLRYIGLYEKDIKSTFVYHSLTHGFIAFLLSSIQITAIDFAISFSFKELFHTQILYSFNVYPIVIIFVASYLFSFITSYLTTLSLTKRKKSK